MNICCSRGVCLKTVSILVMRVEIKTVSVLEIRMEIRPKDRIYIGNNGDTAKDRTCIENKKGDTA